MIESERGPQQRPRTGRSGTPPAMHGAALMFAAGLEVKDCPGTDT